VCGPLEKPFNFVQIETFYGPGIAADVLEVVLIEAEQVEGSMLMRLYLQKLNKLDESALCLNLTRHRLC
jgi:hypothetical protein